MNRQLTTRQAAVVRALTTQHGFTSAQDLHARMRAAGDRIGLATVYRALQAMADNDELDILRGDDGETQYRLCDTDHHHHHLVCRSCGRTEEVQGEGVEAWASAQAQQFGFTAVTHTVELFGLCQDCAR